MVIIIIIILMFNICYTRLKSLYIYQVYKSIVNYMPIILSAKSYYKCFNISIIYHSLYILLWIILYILLLFVCCISKAQTMIAFVWKEIN